MKENKKKLVENSIMLYLMIFSNYFFSFITVPYQTRVLGPSFFGMIGFAVALMMYFQLFMDFGFLLSGTAEISKNRDDKSKVERIYSSIIYIKIIFSIISVLIFSVLIIFIPYLKKDILFFLLYLLATIVNTFLPDYLYRGLEDMKIITYRTLATKSIFTFAIFIFLNTKEDYLVIPLLTLLGNLLAVILSMTHVKNKLGIRIVKINKEDMYEQFFKSKHFFFSRIASTIYTTSNTMIIKAIAPSATLGFYTGADKLMGTGKSALTPISDSIYPYMIKNKDFKLIKKILLICMPIITIFTIIIFVYAESFCTLLLGDDFRGSGNILRSLLPIAIITLPEYLFGFPTLGAIGLSVEANKSIYFGTSFYVVLIIVFYLTGHLNVILICLLTSMTELLVLLYRIVVIHKNRKLWR